MTLVNRILTLGPFETNGYVVTCPETRETAVLDIGFEPERALELVERERLEVRRLICTHAHYDHVAAMAPLVEAFGLPLLLHPLERPLLDAIAVQAATFGLPVPEVPARIEPLAHGDRLTLGHETLEVIHTPGHSPGSVTLRSGDDLWVGDVLFAGSIGRTDFPGSSFEVLVRTIREKLFPLGDRLRVHPGHGPQTTIGQERLHNPFVGERATLA